MPIDPDAYMAGAIPTLSRGGSWRPPDMLTQSPGTSHQSQQQDGSVSMPSSPFGTATRGVTPHAMSGFLQNPLMLGRMAAFGSPTMPPPSTASPLASPFFAVQQNHNQYSKWPLAMSHRSRQHPPVLSALSPSSRFRPSASVAGGQAASTRVRGSPLRYEGWAKQESVYQRMGERSPSERSFHSQATSRHTHPHRSETQSDAIEWQQQGGAPKLINRESDYSSCLRRRGRADAPTAPKSLPASEKQMSEVGRKYRSQPPRRLGPARLDVVSEMDDLLIVNERLRAISNTSEAAISKSEFPPAKPTEARQKKRRIPRRDIATPPKSSLSVTSTPHLKDDTIPSLPLSHGYRSPPSQFASVSNIRSAPNTSASAIFGFRALAEALPEVDQPSPSGYPRGYISPLSHEGYNRYAAHPAAASPAVPSLTDAPTQGPVSVIQSTPQRARTEYIPLGYAPTPKDTPVYRDGPAMKTYGVPWQASEDAGMLSAVPDGPRWTQARPPKMSDVQSEGWW